jgi:hypothetical protein
MILFQQLATKAYLWRAHFKDSESFLEIELINASDIPNLFS